jgi:glycerol-3-phosphate acyltransferase PlsY
VGAFVVRAPLARHCCLAVFVLVVAVTRYVSLGSVIAMVLLPPVAGLLFHAPRAVVTGSAVTALLVVFKHLGNLKRLALGQERKLGAK